MALGLSLPSSYPLYLSTCSPSTSSSIGKVLSLPSLISSFHGIRIQRCAAKALGPHSLREHRGGMLVRAAKREEELKELRDRTTEELNEEVIDLKGELFMLRLQRSARNEFKSSEFRRMRKRIARMLTIKREREIKQGINKRLSRKLDKKWKRSIVVRPPPSLRKKQEEDQKVAETKKST